ncbi:lysosomal Pro-X carboxypeptidase-like protein, partial [Leptotrombidium deliense]
MYQQKVGIYTQKFHTHLYEENYETQLQVDHFSYANNDTFDQRVIVSADHWCRDGCPIFFYTGNEGDIFMFANNTG